MTQSKMLKTSLAMREMIRYRSIKLSTVYLVKKLFRLSVWCSDKV